MALTSEYIKGRIDQEFNKINIWGIPEGTHNAWNYDALKRHASYANSHPKVYKSWARTQLQWALQDYFVKIHQEMARPDCTFEDYHEQLVEELMAWLMKGRSSSFDFHALAEHVITKYHGTDVS